MKRKLTRRHFMAGVGGVSVALPLMLGVSSSAPSLKTLSEASEMRPRFCTLAS